MYKMACLMVMLCCISCQNPTPPVTPEATQNTPSPEPTIAASDEPFVQETVFSLSKETLCVGEEALLSLTRSNLGRGSISIVLTPYAGHNVSNPSVPGGNKWPLPLIEDMALIGKMPVSPIGTGSLTFTLAAEYTTPSGKKIVLAPNQDYLLYWEPRPGALHSVVSFKTCSTE